ncbi:MAG: single-stranded-DNA-specific exonuclease RecJ [bacterium]|nr:single-stranded-DNA-specific exonuclease RecJ [bacterium]
MKRNWILPKCVSPVVVNQLSKSLGTSQIVSELLVSKGYISIEEAYKFLNPKIEDLSDPFLMPQMEIAVNRVIHAIKLQERVLIYGDYDVDGITASALLYRILKDIGLTPMIYIPYRLKEGYGLTEQGVEYCLKSYVNLIITVDCGISEVEEVELLQGKGIDVIITDHHEPRDKLPKALAILNPKIGEHFNELSGCGVAFKLAQGIYKKLGLMDRKLLNYLDLVALATVCDIVPLVGENRIIAKYGMKMLESTENMGLQVLLELTQLKGRPLNTYHLGFILGPRINAQGRLGEAKPAITLLTTENRGEAVRIAQKLEKENLERHQIQEKIVKEAEDEIKKINLDDKIAIVLTKEWHPGVIGVAASKIVEKFYRPVVLIAIDETIGKGSARSIPEFHLYNALCECKELLVSFGGHKLAAGFVIEVKNINHFENKFQSIASLKLKSEELTPKFFINKEILLQEIDENLILELEQFAPFGLGNPRPVFLTKEVQIVGYPKIVGENHVKFKVRGGNNVVLDAIGFNLAKTPLSMGTIVNLIYELGEEEWLGKSNPILYIKDVEILGG